jgi:hypothetical protein
VVSTPNEKPGRPAAKRCGRPTGAASSNRPPARSRNFSPWLTAVEPALDATTWRSWSDYARSYVIPHIGAERLQRLDEPALLRLYAKLLAEGRVKRDYDTVMYAYWSKRTIDGKEPTPRQVSEACNTTIHAARTAVRRYRSGSAQTGFTRTGTQDRPECARLSSPCPRRCGRLEIPKRQPGQ